MPQIHFEFTPGDNTKSFPRPIKGEYRILSLEIEASTLEGLNDAINAMRVYFRFDFGSPRNCFAPVFHIAYYHINVDALITTIEFDEFVFQVDPKQTCTNAIVSIQNDVIAPVTRMTLTLDNI